MRKILVNFWNWNMFIRGNLFNPLFFCKNWPNFCRKSVQFSKIEIFTRGNSNLPWLTTCFLHMSPNNTSHHHHAPVLASYASLNGQRNHVAWHLFVCCIFRPPRELRIHSMPANRSHLTFTYIVNCVMLRRQCYASKVVTMYA